jgi:ubiquinone biosynthesis protein UbiJ
MDRTQILTKLQQLTGNLKPTSRASAAELQSLQTNLAEHIARDSRFNVTGARMHHEGPAALEALSERPATVRHLESVLDRIDTSTERVAPLKMH